MAQAKTLIALTFLQFGTLVAGTSSTSICARVTPGHDFNALNETLLPCYFPLHDGMGTTSCEIGNENPKPYPRCVNNAKCIKNPRSGTGYREGVCVCQKDFKMTSLFTCDRIKGNGETCQFWEGKKLGGPSVQTDNCDGSMGLRCSDGVCQCREPTVNGVCMLGPWEICRIDQRGRNSTAQCARNSHCARISEDDSGYGICTCDEGYDGGWRHGCQKLAGFGEQCDASDNGARCNSKLGFTCRSGTCRCDMSNPDTASTCIIRVGAQCQTGLSQASCPKNATCTNGICTCNNGFQADNSMETCKFLRLRGETCDDSYRSMSMCDSTSGLECQKGKCDCKRGMSGDKKFCLIHTSDQCNVKSAKAHCTPNSICKLQKYADPGMVVGSCSCLDGFDASWVDGKCHRILSKGEACTPTSYQRKDFCNKKLGLVCMGTACSCPNGETTDGRCKLKVEDECNLGADFPPCPPNSKCEGHGEYKHCKCDRNFLSANEGSACVPERSYMETCGVIEGACLHYLPCIAGRCQCRDQDKQVFDPEAKECRSTNLCERGSECPSRSKCEPIYAGSYTKSCKCNEGYSKDSRSLCKSDYMTACKMSSNCFTANSMDCIDGICVCAAPLTKIFNPETKECEGLVGSPCGTGNQKCRETAICGHDRVCRCPSGATLMENGKCVNILNFGANCTQGSPGCDSTKGLACVNNVCACLDPSLKYLGDQRKCVGKEGSICGLAIPIGKCVEERSTGSSIPPCNYYKVSCEAPRSCKETERLGVFRCL